MNISNIDQTSEWFEILQTTGRSQAAVMRLDPGETTGEHAESHEESEQLLLLIEGASDGEIGSERLAMDAGDMINYSSGSET